jgi:photosystem II CP43 chlorophyll apoprotein
MASLAFSVGPGGEVTSLYSYFIIRTLHVISSSIISLGGLYHALLSSDRLEESTYGLLFCYNWQDRFRITAILGAHLLVLGCASFVLFIKAVYLSGVYDTWSSGGGDVRSIKKSDLSLNPYVLARYLARPPFGSSGWILSVNNMEDLVGGHYWVAFYLILGGIWHVQTRPLAIIQRGYTWSAEA